MERQHLGRLIGKFQKGTISESERKQLDRWYDGLSKREGYTQKLSEEEKAVMEMSLWKKINEKIDVPTHAEKERWLPTNIESNRLWLPGLNVAAAVSLVIFAVVVAYFFWYPSTLTHATEFGQTAQVILPDSSIVILNGNSTLTYQNDWGRVDVREVTLQGEAYFSVKRTPTDQKFVVHTSEVVQVEVLGTEFTVSNRPSKTRVVLNSGRVRLNMQDQQREDKLTMNPGELVEFGDNPFHYTKREVNPEAYSSWKDKKMVLDRTSLQELLTMIEDTYGVTLQVVEKGLLDQRMSGKVPANNLDTLIQDIAAIYKVNFQHY